MAPTASYPVLAIYFSDIYPVLRSVASAYTISHNIKYTWSSSDLIFDPAQRAGVWELQVPNPQQLRHDINWQTEELVTGFVKHACLGPERLQLFLKGKLQVKAKCISNIHSTIAEFNQVNNEAMLKLDAAVKLAKAGRFVNNMALIGATITAGALYAGATAEGALWTASEAAGWIGGGQVGIIGAPLLKSLGVTLVKSWELAPEAKSVQIMFEAKKAGVSYAAEKSGDGMQKLERHFKSSRDVAQASKAEELAKTKLEAQVAERKRNNKRSRSAKHKGKTGQANRSRTQAKQVNSAKTKYYNAKDIHSNTRASANFGKTLKGLGSVITTTASTIFTAWDVYDAFAELNE